MRSGLTSFIHQFGEDFVMHPKVKVSFLRKSDGKLAEDPAAAVKKLGVDCARQLRARLADLHAAQAVGELVAGQPHPLKGDREGVRGEAERRPASRLRTCR